MTPTFYRIDSYTNRDGDTRVDAYEMDGDRADPLSP